MISLGVDTMDSIIMTKIVFDLLNSDLQNLDFILHVR